ncbi:hypothetical protein FRC03_004479 [Tulasnella sp. 419]|nr:hypothetical protein FRC03_004479 [Tulasnella sp. 419]
MFFGKIISTAVLGFTALAGIATASVVPAAAHNIEVRQVTSPVDTPGAALDIVTKFQTNVNGILPKLVDYDRAGQDTTPVFNALFQYYDETTKLLLNLPPYQSPTKEPSDVVQKVIDISNDVLNSAIAVSNILRPTRVNVAQKQILADRTNQVIKALSIIIDITIGRVRIIIIIR